MDTYTFKYRDDGLLLNTDAIAPFVDIARIEGLSNVPYRTTEREREGQDGGFVDAEFEQMRTLVIEGTAYATVDTLETYLEQLKKNFEPTKTPQPFYLQPPGLSERVIFCKSYGIKYDWGLERRLGYTPIQIQLIAEDPTIYDSIPVSKTTLLPTVVGGRGYNKQFNYGYGFGLLTLDSYDDAYEDDYGSGRSSEDISTDGIIVLYNGGNKNTGAEITINGPILNPIVIHDVSGKQLAFDINLSANQFLTINLRAKSVLLNGTSSRRHTLRNTSRWFTLPPGYNSLRLLGSDTVSGEPDPSMTVQVRGAYR